MNIIFILPNQLFENNKLINKNTKVYIYEHPIYFTKYQYHKLKLILHRATMKNYAEYLQTNIGCKIKYLDYDYEINDVFKKYKNNRIDLYDPVDHDVIREFKKYSKTHNIELFIHDTPLFLSKLNDLNDYLKNGGTYHQTTFYIWQRKRLNILLNKNSKPIGNKWTFDTENREPYNKNFNVDAKFKLNENIHVQEAKRYVEKHFVDNIGRTDFYLPIDHPSAKKHLHKFLKDRLKNFGKYQDTVSKDIIFGSHSILSPLLNIGLLTPQYVIDQILKYYEQNKNIPLASVEGIIRQIIGWREIIRMMYIFKHKEMKNMNHFNHQHKLTKNWYNATTGIEPIDDLIIKVTKYGYLHHIERLMYIGNFLLLTEMNINDVFKWFMVFFIDSYQWVMEANVYAMSQFSTGPLLMTRPYFSSSNYIDKMSSYKKKPGIYKKILLNGEEYEWYEVWDALYYNFINNNKQEFSKNYAIASSVAHWKNKNIKTQNNLLKIAKGYLEKY